LMNYYWSEEEVNERMEKMMIDAFESCYKTHKTYRVHMRLAAYLLAVQRLGEAMRIRGWLD